VTLDKALRSQTERLLGLLGWHGVAMVEYKQDARTGRFYLMEINGRFWGSLQLAIDAGVDFPYLSFQLAAGMDLDLPRAYKVGVKSRWLLGDVDHLWLRLSRRGDDLPPGTPSRLSTALDFMKFSTPGLRYDVMSYDDPQPMVYEFHQYAKELAVSAGRRVRREIKRICRPQESAAPAIATPAASRSPHDGALG
jgi:biotin carboxylase